MKAFDINKMGVSEMTQQEIQETNGGVLLIILAFTAVAREVISRLAEDSKSEK